MAALTSTPSNNAKWSGTRDIPTLGENVTVKMNSLGTGKVVGFRVLEGYQAVGVSLDNPPEWFLNNFSKGQEPVATVFGAEIG